MANAVVIGSMAINVMNKSCTECIAAQWKNRSNHADDDGTLRVRAMALTMLATCQPIVDCVVFCVVRQELLVLYVITHIVNL